MEASCGCWGLDCTQKQHQCFSAQSSSLKQCWFGEECNAVVVAGGVRLVRFGGIVWVLICPSFPLALPCTVYDCRFEDQGKADEAERGKKGHT